MKFNYQKPAAIVSNQTRPINDDANANIEAACVVVNTVTSIGVVSVDI